MLAQSRHPVGKTEKETEIMTENAKRPLAEIIGELLAKSTKQKPGPKAPTTRPSSAPAPTEREMRIQRILSQRWRNEQLILLVTRTRCECGELYTAPHPRMFIRRFHPQFGVHLEPLMVRPHSPMIAASPPIVEYIDENASICHRCLPSRQETAKNEAKQTVFDFTDCIIQNLPHLYEGEIPQ